MIRPLALTVAAAALSIVSAARAADPAETSDLRCLAVAATLAQSPDSKMQKAGAMAGLYYLGKLDGRTPSVDLEARLKQELAQITPQDLAAETQRCGAQLAARGQAMAQIGARLQAEAAAKP